MTVKKIKSKKLAALALGCIIMLSSATSVFAADVGGGVWDYGTKVVGINEKKVYSNYYHGSKVHKSSCSIGTTTVSSGWVSAGSTSYASATGKWSAETHAYYDYQD